MMKKILAVISAALIACPATGCGSHGAAVAKVVTTSVDDGTRNYEIVYADGKAEKTDEFTPQADTIYRTDNGDYSSYVKDGKIKAVLKSTKLTDEDGNVIEPDENTAALMQYIADNSEHDIIAVYFMNLQDKYFAMAELNVNWWDPCILYMYDSGKQQFSELHQWDNVKLAGVSSTD